MFVPNYEETMSYARKCGLGASLDLPGRVLDVSTGRDIVTRKHGIRLVAGNFARGFLRHAAAHHVPDGRAPAIMKEQARHPGGLRHLVPCFTEVDDGLAILPGEEKILGLLSSAQFGD